MGELVKKALGHLDTINMGRLMYMLRAANDGAKRDVQDKEKSLYYLWTIGLIKELKPKQVVELGGAMGVWDLCVLYALPKDSKLWSITLEEGGLEFSYVVDDYPNFEPIIGNDLDLSLWPRNLNLKETDLWFFDALHTEEHLRKELDLYSPFFKKGAVILFDDIHSFGLDKVWDDISKGKWGITDTYDATPNKLHYSGYGVCQV